MGVHRIGEIGDRASERQAALGCMGQMEWEKGCGESGIGKRGEGSHGRQRQR